MGHAAQRQLAFQQHFFARLRGLPVMQHNQPSAWTAAAAQILVHHVAVCRRRLFVNQQVVERQRRMLEEDFAAQRTKFLRESRPVALCLRILLVFYGGANGGELLRIAVHRRRLRNIVQRAFRQCHDAVNFRHRAQRLARRDIQLHKVELRRLRIGKQLIQIRRKTLSAPPLLRRQFFDDRDQFIRQSVTVFNHKTMAAANTQVLVDPARHLRELLVQFVPCLHGGPHRGTACIQRISHPPIGRPVGIFVATADDREFRVLFVKFKADIAVRVGEPPFVIVLSRDVYFLVDFILVDANLVPLRPRAFDLRLDRGFRRAVSLCKNGIHPGRMVAAVAVAAIIDDQPKFVQFCHIRRQGDRLLAPFDFQLCVQRLPRIRRQCVDFLQSLAAGLLPSIGRTGKQTSTYRQQYQQKGFFHDDIPMVYVTTASSPSKVV